QIVGELLASAPVTKTASLCDHCSVIIYLLCFSIHSLTTNIKYLSIKKSVCSFINFLLLFFQDPFRLVFPAQLRETLEATKLLNKITPPGGRKRQSSHSKQQHSNLFLPSALLENPHPNGIIHSVEQDAPLDLITKPRSQTSKTPDKPLLAAASPGFNTPINLTTGAKERSTGLTAPSRSAQPSPNPSTRAAQRKASRPVHRAGTHSHLLQSLVDVFRGTESDITSSKDSDDSVMDEDEAEDEDDKDSDDSLTDSGSNLDSDDSDDVDDDEDDKDEEMETDTENEQTPQKLSKSVSSLTNSTPTMVSSSSSLNLQIRNLSAMPMSALVTSSGTLVYPSTPSSSSSLPTTPGSRKRRRVTDEGALRRPLDYGWQREIRIRNICGRIQGEVAYYAPCGKKLKQYPDVMKVRKIFLSYLYFCAAMLRSRALELSVSLNHFSKRLKFRRRSCIIESVQNHISEKSNHNKMHHKRTISQIIGQICLGQEQERKKASICFLVISPHSLLIDRSRLNQQAKTALGEHLCSVNINRENASEILQIYMSAHCSQTELAFLVESLKTKAFQAHTPTQKASILAFLVNELACSKSVVTEIDKNIDHMTNLRRDKLVIEGSLRKLRIIYAKRTGKRESGIGGEESQNLGTPSSSHKRKRKVGDSEDDDDEEEDSDDQGEEEDDEEEEGLKKGRKTETCEDEDDDQTASLEELERQIEKLTKNQSLIRRKLFESSQFLRSMMFGQDRYKRRYWVLPQCGGVFVEGMESGEGPEELQKERERMQNAPQVQVKEEPMEVPADKALCASPEVKREAHSPDPKQEKDSLNLFLQKPDSFSKLSKLLEVAKMSSESQSQPQGLLPPAAHLPTNTPPTLPSSLHTLPQSSTPNQDVKSELTAPLLNPTFLGNLQHQLHSDQLYRALTEKNVHWFSLLPRSPCDNFSLANSLTPPPSSSSPQPCNTKAQSPTNNTTQPPSSLSPNNNNHHTYFCLCLQKPGMRLMGLPFCHWPKGLAGINMQFGGVSLSPTLGRIYAEAEGNGTGNLFQTPTKSESLERSCEKPPAAPSPVLEISKNQDLPFPQPIPEEMLTGWWKVSTLEELSSIVNACHSRGIREKVLQKQLQKHMEYITQVCAKNKDAAVIDVCELKQSQVSEETVLSWCVEEHAMDLDIAVLQQVEELERRVTSASLQVKGWMPPEPQSEREDLVYYQHKAVSENDSEPADKLETSIVRHANNPLDIAVARLSELERSIERRYLKSPLSTTIQITLDNVGTVTVPAPAPSPSADGDGGEEELAPGMKQWRKALSEVRSGAQLSLCLQQLQRSIAWERSIMKVYCQMCRKGDNEELLLLCDGCDKGCHTYCHKPQISTIPEGDWFCPACIAKASRTSGGAKKPSEVKRSKKACVAGEGSEEDSASTSASSTPKKGTKETKKRKTESLSTDAAQEESSGQVKKAKTTRDNSKDLELCRLLLAELQSHQDAWPFMIPVNPKSVPGYRKVIKKPMDFSTIREKLSNSQYQNLETFIIDVNLVFDNCEKFNEDHSDIGRAGHNMRRFFQRRWTELLKQIN
uniref:Bromodomain adjacent to zinc finger domain 2B n=1 Tax=Astyanax mexicanus TaxID=7994 RepID=A0A8B9JD06_ASTMX